MANTYSWNIQQLECYPEQDTYSNVVFRIHWRREANNGVHKTDVYGIQNVDFDSSSFTPYEELTQVQIEGWLNNAIGPSRIKELDFELDRKLAEQVTPSVISPNLPW